MQVQQVEEKEERKIVATVENPEPIEPIEEIENGKLDEEVVEQEDEDESKITTVETPGGLAKKKEEGADEEDGDDKGNLIVTIDGEASEDAEAELEAAPKWVKEVRKRNREMTKENRELREQLAAQEKAKASQQKLQLGPKPKLEDADYDEDVHDTRLSEWYETKAKVEEQNRQAQLEIEQQNLDWQKRVKAYGQKKENLGVSDYEEAETLVNSVLSQDQMYILIDGAEDPALLMYALGRNPKRLQQLADEKKNSRFATALGRLESKLKTSKRKPSVEPERKLTGTAPVSGTIDSTLDKLRADAAKSGDNSKVIAYRRKHRDKG